MSVDKNLEVSKIIRAIMKIHGKTRIFNNLYPNGTRTVKCYASEIEDVRLELAIKGVLSAVSFYGYEIVRTKGRRYGASGFIVKLY